MRDLVRGLAGSKGKAAGFSLMSAGSFVVAALTYLRQAEIAGVFGTTWMTDAYAVALVFPMLAQQVVSHAFGSSFIPIYSQVMHDRGRSAADALVSRILCWIASAGAVTILILFVSSRSLVTAAGPGLQPASLGLSSSMLRIMLPILVLTSASGILTGLVTAQRRYGVVSAVNILNVLVSWIFVVLGHGRFGIMVLPLSGLAGAAVMFAAALFSALRFGFAFRPVIDPRDEDFRRLLVMSGPVVAGVLIGFLSPIVDKILASFLAASSVTALDYAIRVKDMVLVLTFVPVSALSDVALSEKSASGDMAAFRREMTSLLNWTSFMMLPIAVLLCVTATPVVSVLFMRGSFGRESTLMVGYALAFYAPWLAQFGFGAVVSRGFYALKDSRTPVLIGIWGIVVNVLLNIILIVPMGIGGIALATTLASTAKTVLLVWFIRRRTGGFDGGLFGEHARLLAASAAMTATLLLLSGVLPADLDAGTASRASTLALRVLPSVAVYLGVCLLTGSVTARELLARIARVRGRREGPPEQL